MKVIDISRYNGVIQWGKVNADGVIIRAGYRGYAKGKLATDTSFSKNIEGAKAARLPVGVYFVTQAIDENEAKEEAEYTLRLIKGYSLDLPIFIDSEDANKGQGRADHGKLSQKKRTEILRAFCEEIEAAGYKAGIYAGEFWATHYCNVAKLQDFYIWIAKYSTRKPNCFYHAWQYNDKGRINGIKGNVDLSYFTDVIQNRKSNEEIAKEVINGEWGTGEERARRLEEAGYNYRDVQELVNSMVKPKQVKKYVYVVKRGDTLGGIAKKFNTTVESLVKLNKITNPNFIEVGKTITIKKEG